MLQLRFAGLPYENYMVPGLCICGTTETEALEVGYLVEAYFEQSGVKQTSLLGFETEAGRTSFFFDLGPVGSVDITDVDPDIPRQVLQGLAHFRYFGVYFGVSGPTFRMIDPKKFHLFRSELLMNGELVRGNDSIAVDWVTLL